jgi:hemolysin activation/secretion protein
LKNKLIAVLSASVAIGFSANVFADPNLDAGALQQQIEKEAPDVFTSPLPSVGAPESVPQADDGVQILIHGVRLQGVQLVNEHELLDRLAPSLEKSYSLQGLQKLVDVVTAFYSERGFVIQAYLPQQSIDKDGIVTIQVLEAKLGDVKVENINDQARLSNEKAANYIKAQMPVGQPLNANLVSKGLVLLNELPGIKVVSALEAGDRDGETNIHLSLKRTSLIDARVETKNGGNRSTGVAQAVLSLSSNSPFKMGDQASFYGLYSEGSSFNQVGYSLPIGYGGLRLGLTGNYLEYENIGSYKVNGGYGHASTLAANISYPLKRSQSTNINLLAAYEHKAYTNRQLKLDDINSRYSIRNINLGFNANHYDSVWGGGLTSITTNLTLGNFDIDSDSPSNFSYLPGDRRFVPSDFQKVSFNASRIQVLPLDGTQLNINVSGQVSDDNLNSAEQFYLGGPFGVRAYPVAQGNGSQGMLATLELQKRLPYNLTGIAFFDAGTVQQYKNQSEYRELKGNTSADNSYELYGAGFGLKWNSGHWNLSSVIAWKVGSNPLKTGTGSSQDNDGTDTSPRAWLNGSYTF